MEAINHNTRGIKAEARGDHELALEEFGQSLRLNGALDNGEGMIVALVNMSRVHRRTGAVKAAYKAVNRALELVTPKADIFAEVAFEKSSVELQADNLPGAREWAAKAISSATDKRKAAATNLLARILHREKQYAAAGELAEQALAAARTSKQPEEEANALRLIGAVQAETNRTTEALEALGKALELDKSVGKSRKIAADLRGMADTHAAMSKNLEAISFYRRAVSVSLSDGDKVAAAEDLLRLARLYEKMGDRQRSLQLMEEREALVQQAGKPVDTPQP
jgi:tetratricopeptide (TPR) repeat protein